MTTELQNNLNAILLDKNTNLLPQNLKDGITCLGVEGTLTSESGQVKLFQTKEEMEQYTTTQEGDLALVYQSTLNNFTQDTEAQYITFPETVTLPEQSDNVSCMIECADHSIFLDGYLRLEQRIFEITTFGELGNIRITYESDDGINYVRTEFASDDVVLSNPVDFGSPIRIQNEGSDSWSDNIGYFMKISSNVFDGLFKYTTHSSLDNCITLTEGMNYVLYMPEPKLPVQFESIGYRVYITYLIKSVKLKEHYGNIDIYEPNDYAILYNHNEVSGGTGESVNRLISDNQNCYIGGKSWVAGANSEHINEIGLVLEKYENREMILGQIFTHSQLLQIRTQISNIDGSWEYFTYTLNNLSDYDLNSVGTYCLWCDNAAQFYRGVGSSGDELKYRYDGAFTNLPLNPFSFTRIPTYTETVNYQRWDGAPSQFTLSGPDELIAGAIALGKDGTVTGDGSIMTANSNFDDVPAMLWGNIQSYYDNMQPNILEDYMKFIDRDIYAVPSKSDGTPLLITTNIINGYNLFCNCRNLTYISDIDLSNVTNYGNMFRDCTNLKRLPNMDMTNANNCVNLFYNCTNLSNINISNTSNIVNAYNMFSRTNVSNMDGLDLGNTQFAQNLFQGCSNLVSANNINISNIDKPSFLFADCVNLKYIENLQFTFTNARSSLFENTGFEKLSDVNIDLSNITYSEYLFRNCKNLYDISNFQQNNLQTAFSMFSGCVNIKEIPDQFFNNIPNVTNMGAMFQGCSNITTLPNINHINANDCAYMFNNCSNLSNIQYINLPNATNCVRMFSACNFTNIDASNWLLNSVTNAAYLFCNCNNLTTISNLDLPNATNGVDLWQNCFNLTTVNNIYLNNVTNTYRMFSDCYNLVNIDENKLHISTINRSSYMFINCTNLINIGNILMNIAINTNGVSTFTHCESLNSLPNIAYNNLNTAAYMFSYCNNITNLGRTLNLNRCVNIQGMFCYSGLTSVDMNDIKLKSNINSIHSLFSGCVNLHTVTNLNLSGTNITNCSYLFNGCASLPDSITFNTSSNMYQCGYMFSNCYNFTTIPNINYNTIYNASNLFANCVNITHINSLNLYRAYNCRYIFYGCTNLVNIQNITFNNMANLDAGFSDCTSLVNAPNLNLNKCQSMRWLFRNCSNLVNIPLYNLSSIYTCDDFVQNCPNLSNDSLNNILQMCTQISNVKNLYHIGLTEDQANICMNLSNYQNFINSGWTTGY